MIVIGSSPLSWLKESGCNITKYTEHHEAVEMNLLANELQMRSSRFRRIKSAALIKFILILEAPNPLKDPVNMESPLSLETLKPLDLWYP